MVNWLCDVQRRLGLIDWVDEHQVLHRGWQAEVQWAVVGEIDYHRYMLAMDRLHPHRARIEEAVFARTTNLLSLPLRLCFDYLISTYFEGDASASWRSTGTRATTGITARRWSSAWPSGRKACP